ncbi:DUF2269 domain-containing protein [Pseudomonas sp. 21LCFQ010]|uniref:DUF2269 family protein n=1 Tax=Pseudomonas sp. 21LCFQ010 TaxID=2957506 RepID=UPI002096C408|nr:DUF2269 domain-containing protein [Pseudomonas sp. 21LCFQ010]MCO8161306.1 DUF2269 domain-containing protein [Pseudomonas sp. 21LCFQ010]
MTYLYLKYLHVIAAIFLFGFGMGSYLYLIAAQRTRNPVVIASVAQMVVRFDTWITTPAGVLQLATGLGMLHLTGLSIAQPWLRDALIVFVAVGLLWLPVLVLQKRMQSLAEHAAERGLALPSNWNRLYRPWLWMGVAGFAGMFVIVLLMVTKQGLF